MAKKTVAYAIYDSNWRITFNIARRIFRKVIKHFYLIDLVYAILFLVELGIRVGFLSYYDLSLHADLI